jgi:plastocyanin
VDEEAKADRRPGDDGTSPASRSRCCAVASVQPTVTQRLESEDDEMNERDPVGETRTYQKPAKASLGLRALGLALLLGLAAAALATASPAVHSDEDDNEPARIAMRDECDPDDPGWAQIGGCERRRGDVSRAEFAAENGFPVSLSLSVIGHQAWRNDPSYLETTEGERVRVTNAGGRVHTFTRVAQFGGGKAANPAFNKGLVPSQECPESMDVAPGESLLVSGLEVGNHRFMCCIHPWMRAMIKVKRRGNGGD